MSRTRFDPLLIGLDSSFDSLSIELDSRFDPLFKFPDLSSDPLSIQLEPGVDPFYPTRT